MRITKSFVRACTALALVSACGESAQASTPALVWSGLAHVNVLCLVQTEAGVDDGPLRDRICGRVRDSAAAGSPAPVAIIALGDPAVLSPDSVTLLVHASVQSGGPRPLLAFTIRPFRNNAEPLLFTAAPRAVPLADPSGPAPELEAALVAALSETLPWLNRPAGARPIR